MAYCVYCPNLKNASPGQSISLPDKEAHHLIKVRRIRSGADLMVFDGQGGAMRAKLVCESSPPSAELKSDARCSELWPKLELAVGMIKHKAMEWLIREASALGVSRIQLLDCKHSESRVSAKSLESKKQRWKSVALEGCKQSGQLILPAIEQPIEVGRFAAQLSRANSQRIASLVCSLEQTASPLGDALGRYANKGFVSALERICVIIGPEGDFSPEEYDQLRRSATDEVFFGNLVLRSETAALYSLSVIDHWRK